MPEDSYTPADDAVLSAGLDLGYREGRPSPRDEDAEEDQDTTPGRPEDDAE